jgi:hypothetical protein
MGKHDDYDYDDEGYYEDDELDEDCLELRERIKRRVFAVFGTSYGISVLVHVAILLILATIVIAGPAAVQEAKIMVTKANLPKPYDREKDKALEPEPEIPIPEETKDPRVKLDDSPVCEVPQGEPDNPTDKNLESDSLTDVAGVGATGAAGAWGNPRALRRDAFIGGGGGSPGYETCPRAALMWLQDHQARAGNWDSDGWQDSCKHGGCKGPKSGCENGSSGVDVGLTSLALLAYTGYGASHRHGEFKHTVNKARRWLLRSQRSDGSVGFVEGGVHGGMYNHAIATMALAELYAVTRDFTLKRPAQKAVDFCLKAQNSNLGWRYQVKGGRNDTSVTGWMVLALKAAKVAGLSVPAEAFAGAKRWFDRATTSRGEAGYITPGGGSSMLNENDGKFDPLPVMTSVSVVCRVFTGERTTSEAVRKGSKILAADLPSWAPRKMNYYYWYYGTYAMYQVDGPRWKSWEKAMLSALVPNQRSGGCEDGSWDPVGEWCRAGGRVYATAINCLTLEIHYRYKRQAKG